MLDLADVDALIAARHADPFAVLGLHNDATDQLWLRALLPGATEVQVLDASTLKRVATLSLRHPAGLFEAKIPRRKNRFDYVLKIRWHNGDTNHFIDAYAFGAQISDDDLRALRDGTHLRPYTILGAQLGENAKVKGVRFAVWAPNALRVSVVGDFNNWDGRRHAMRLRHDAGVWEIFIPQIGAGEHYKYEIVAANGKLLPLKADPYALSAQLRPETASKVTALPAIHALPQNRAAANQRRAPISIYEVHLASWRQASSGSFPTWDELAKTLPDYAADMGFTHIELMPISEYPFDGSWGYQTLGLYAPTARFGPPEGLIRLVAACHEKNIGVLLDWVPAHFPSDAHGLAQFDGTALYEYADPHEGFHRDWNTLIYNFGRNEVSMYLKANALYWTERFGVDGLRVDAVASMLYRDYSRKKGEWIPNHLGGRENLEAIDLLRKTNEIIGAHGNGAITIAEESTAFPGVSAPTYSGGLGFHYKWNMGWMNDTLEYMHEDPVHRRFHHDKMSFGMVYAFSENFELPITHDEVVHGKGSMLKKMSGDEWQKFANLRAYYAFMWGHPGKKLLFMGQEFAQTTEWNHDATLPWHLLDDMRHRGVQQLVRDLNHLYVANTALHQLDCEPSGFEWLVANDAAQSVFVWLRRDEQGKQMLVVCNFTPVPRPAYRIGVSDNMAYWSVVLNTDAVEYGGSGFDTGVNKIKSESLPAHGKKFSLTLNIPPLAVLYLRAE